MPGSSRWIEDQIRERIGTRDRLAIFSDFDGTLSPHVPTPGEAHLDIEMKQTLEGLARSPRVKLAVISGRSLIDLTSRVAIEGVYLAGSHGIEIAGPTISFLHPLAAQRAGIKREMTRALRASFRGVPGVVIEEKPYSIACHYREAPQARASAIFRSMRRALPNRLQGWRILKEQDVIEILPVRWTKGSCARLLLAHYVAMGDVWGMSLSIAIGDDSSDQDIFQAISPTGICVGVGGSTRVRVEYRLADISEVRRLLGFLHDRFRNG